MLHSASALRKDRATAAKSPTMQHRHFSVIAAIIEGMPLDMRHLTAEIFASSLRHTNPHFSRARFLKACGVEG